MHHIGSIRKGLSAGAVLHNVQAMSGVSQQRTVVGVICISGIDDKRIQCGRGGVVAITGRLDRPGVNERISRAAYTCNPRRFTADSQPGTAVSIAPKVDNHIFGCILVRQTHVLHGAVIVLLVDDERTAERIVTAKHHTRRTRMIPIDIAVPLDGTITCQ